jgi:hypothetical protein
MSILNDIWSSIVGSTKTRITDPIIGTFIVSWVICNWNYLSLLFLGEGNTTQRISGFYLYLSHVDLWAINSAFTIPLILTILYLFIFPWISWAAKYLQIAVNDRLHKQAVGIDFSKVTQQEKLNKAKLRANPDKIFLEQIVQLEIDRKNEISEQRKQRTLRFEAKAKEAIEKTKEAESNKNIAKMDEDKKIKQEILESLRFSISTAEVRATLASNRFPSAFLFMKLIAESVKEDNIILSLPALSEIVASIFGYSDFKALLDDEKFNNESLSNVEYIYYDDNKLAKKLENIVSNESSDNEDLTSEMLFDHIRMVFEELPYRFVDLDTLTQLSVEFCENDTIALLENDGTYGAIAESDSTFDEVEIEGAESSNFDDGFIAFINASASGSHKKDSEIGGRDMSITAVINSPVLLGKYALGELEIDTVNGNLVDYWEEE